MIISTLAYFYSRGEFHEAMPAAKEKRQGAVALMPIVFSLIPGKSQIDSNLGSSVYSPLRRGLAGVRLEEADEMLGIIEAEKGTDLGYRKHF